MNKKNLSTGKDSIIDKIFDSRAEELAEEKNGVHSMDTTERFLDIVSNVKDETLQNQLRTIYLKEDDLAGEECAKLIKRYYENRLCRRSKTNYRMCEWRYWKMNITYTQVGDYLIPDLTIPETNNNAVLGKYSHLRLAYLKQNKRGFYTSLKMKNELTNHLAEIQEIASQRVENIIKELAEKENITEELKANNQLKWVRTYE